MWRKCDHVRGGIPKPNIVLGTFPRLGFVLFKLNMYLVSTILGECVKRLVHLAAVFNKDSTLGILRL